MKPYTLRKIRRAIESFFYKVRFNIGLYNIIHSPIYYGFRTKIELVVRKQILHFATVEKVNVIIGLKKAVKKLTDKDLLKNIAILWVALDVFIEKPEIEDYLIWAANKGGKIGLDKLKSDKEFDLRNRVLLRQVKNRTKEMVEMVDKTTQDWIARTIEQGLKDNLSSLEIARLLRDSANHMAKERAMVIAEHEAILMLGEAEVEIYKKNKILLYKWITARDELVCPDCMANEEAGEIPVGEVFPGGVLAPPQHQRCRCILIPSIPLDLKIKWSGQ